MITLLDTLGYEQLRALRVLRDTPNVDGVTLCSQADCSWAEMFILAEKGLINVGAQRVIPNRLHPVLLPLGQQILDDALQRIPGL